MVTCVSCLRLAFGIPEARSLPRSGPEVPPSRIAEDGRADIGHLAGLVTRVRGPPRTTGPNIHHESDRPSTPHRSAARSWLPTPLERSGLQRRQVDGDACTPRVWRGATTARSTKREERRGLVPGGSFNESLDVVHWAGAQLTSDRVHRQRKSAPHLANWRANSHVSICTIGNSCSRCSDRRRLFVCPTWRRCCEAPATGRGHCQTQPGFALCTGTDPTKRWMVRKRVKSSDVVYDG